jgi:hypothetical protein
MNPLLRKCSFCSEVSGAGGDAMFAMLINLCPVSIPISGSLSRNSDEL